MKKNNYPSWLVSIEQAEKLKKIGFDLPTQNTTSIEVLESKRYKDENKIYSKEYVLKGNLYNANETKGGLSIPTWEQAFEWFREKGLVGTIVYFKDTFLNKTLYSFEVKDEKGYLVSASRDIIEKYEVAREKLLNSLIEALS